MNVMFFITASAVNVLLVYYNLPLFVNTTTKRLIGC